MLLLLEIGEIPVSSVRNGFVFPERPPQLEMEGRQISPCIPFMQFMENLEVKILCVGLLKFLHMLTKQLNVYRECLQEAEAIQVKLKSKDAFKHHVLHEPVRPNKCIDALQWLIEKSDLLGIKV